MIVHADEDDLGEGGYPDSLTNGHSGKRVLWGIIGVADDVCDLAK
jgi:Cu-Zn family superoxide dismutase